MSVPVLNQHVGTERMGWTNHHPAHSHPDISQMTYNCQFVFTVKTVTLY
jgi:hypothetical protein